MAEEVAQEGAVHRCKLCGWLGSIVVGAPTPESIHEWYEHMRVVHPAHLAVIDRLAEAERAGYVTIRQDGSTA